MVGSWTGLRAQGVCCAIALMLAAGCTTVEEAAQDVTEEAGEVADAVESRVEEGAWEPADAPLMTRWASEVSPNNAHPEYPRPQMRRTDWENLNGLWEYELLGSATAVSDAVNPEGRILVPFAAESALSGVRERTDRIRYRRTFTIPSDWQGERVLLHFGAVDWHATVFVNGRRLGSHRGGYGAFSFDVTAALHEGGPQELVVDAYDPTDDGDQPRGKQVNDPRGIWYTPVTGIWQTVWLEPVPSSHIADFTIEPDIDRGVLRLQVETENAEGLDITAIARSDGAEVGRATGGADETVEIPIPNARLWSPDDPFLYDLDVQLTDGGNVVDAVESYFGMREVSVGPGPDGEPRLLLNGEFVFQLGPLDQGYWPDGLYTAPNDEALRYDIELTKQLGFNMSRKHVKIEPARWYYWADHVGLLIWQDMPNGDNTTPESRRQFERELTEMVDQFYNHPSIIMWIVFNEGWGQHDAERLTERVEAIDPTRIVMDVSGWQHAGAGDVLDVHRYPGPAAMEPADGKASVVGEFGGVGYVIDEHTWAGEGWGYEGVVESKAAYEERYEYLTQEMWRLRDAADMSAGVYTQITDVEVEVNGLMTYDRDVLKIALERGNAVNEGRTPFIQPNDGSFVDEVEVTITNWAPRTVIRYTTDGSVPVASSQQYDGPFTLDESTAVSARAFEGGEPVSPVTTVAFTKTDGRAAEADLQLEPGVSFAYFEDAAEQRHPFAHHWPVRQIAAGNRDVEPVRTGIMERIQLPPGTRDELFAVNYDGYFDAPETGVYTFTIYADDGARLYIGDEPVTDRMGQSPTTTWTSGRIALQEGLHPFTIRYFQAYGPAELNVLVEGPGLQRQPLPEAMIRRAPAAAE